MRTNPEFVEQGGGPAVSVEMLAGAVLFDMDGTLVDSSVVVERIWSQWAVGHSLDPAAVLSVVHGRQSQQRMAILLPDRSREENLADNRAMVERETTELDGIVAVAGAAELLASLAGLPHARGHIRDRAAGSRAHDRRRSRDAPHGRDGRGRLG
jgi:beta-phosphoglucomutase-like phosphatase (HAD superfamily)